MGKISIHELAEEIVQKHALSSKDAEAFVSEMFALINEGLSLDGIVKIKGFGTFKVIDVLPRESINVNTGQRVLIEGHGKITFTPDPIMRDLVNRPFSQFETVILNEGVSIEKMNFIPSEQAEKNEESLQEEIEETQDKNPTPSIEKKEQQASIAKDETIAVTKDEIATTTKEETSTTTKEETIATTKEETIANTIEKEESKEEAEDLVPKEDKEITSKTSSATQEEAKEKPQKSVQKESTSNGTDKEILDERNETSASWLSSHKTIVASIAIVILIIGVIIGYFSRKTSSSENSAIAENQVTLASDSTQESAEVSLDGTSNENQQEATKELPKELNNALYAVNTGAYNIVGTDKTITVKPGEDIKSIASHYLGNEMECYIQVHNGILEVEEGMSLKIPKLEYTNAFKKYNSKKGKKRR